MFKTILILSCLLLYQSADLLGQLNPYKFRIGAGIGYSNYYGDLSHYRYGNFPDWKAMGEAYSYNKNYNQSPSFSLSIERRLNSSFGLLLNGGQYILSMSDRYLDKNDVLKTDFPNFHRSLNFETSVRDIGLGFTFRTDNGKILRENALVAPYLSIHGGWLQFSPKGDLLDAEGNQYDYTQNLLITDGNFETDLTKLKASSNNGYDENTYYIGAGVGFRIKLSKQIEVYFQSDVKRTNTDFIDDVDGSSITTFLDEFQTYAAYPGIDLSNANSNIRGDIQSNKDWFFNHQFGLKISFSPSKNAFRANAISPSFTHIRSEYSINDEYIEVDSSKNSAISELRINHSSRINEKQASPEENALPNVYSSQETPALMELDSIGNFTLENSERYEANQRANRVMVWQYPYRINDSGFENPPYEQTYYNPYYGNYPAEQNIPQKNEKLILGASDGQVTNSSFPYFLPYYSRSSTYVNQPANANKPMGIDSTLIVDSSRYVPFDSVKTSSLSPEIKATSRQNIASQKYKFEPGPSIQGMNLQGYNSGKGKVDLIKNGLYAEVFFENNESKISEEEVLKLLPLKQMLDLFPNAKLLIKAYADNTGAMAYNMILIERRAMAVEEILTNQLGLAPERITRQPGAQLIRGSHKTSRPQDRKVEVQVLY